jgi:hypothetical protein
MELPELPPYMYGRECGPNERVYTAEKVQDLMRQAVLMEREACAQVCDTFAVKITLTGGLTSFDPADCASAIRSRT